MTTHSAGKCPEVKEVGVTEIYAPSGQDSILADVIFVHGLKGHPQRTWQYGKPPDDTEGKDEKGSPKSFWKWKRRKSKGTQSESGEASKTNESCFWPWDLLSSEFNNIRVLMYGYDSHPSHFYKGPANQMTISQHGRDLLEEVINSRSKCKTRPIIFVAHGLGGILVKEAIVESKKYIQQPRMQEVANFCRAIFFFGTPHLGANAADWAIVFSNIVGAIPLGVSTYKEILRGLAPDSEKLDNLARDFNDILNADIPFEQKIRIFSFQEGKGMAGLVKFDGKARHSNASISPQN